MSSIVKLNNIRQRKRLRIRGKLLAQNRRNLKRIYVDISNKHINIQLIDDLKGVTLCGVTSKGKAFASEGAANATKETAKKVADKFVQAMQAAKVDFSESMLFDRGIRLYHGRLAAIADVLREKGVKI